MCTILAYRMSIRYSWIDDGIVWPSPKVKVVAVELCHI